MSRQWKLFRRQLCRAFGNLRGSRDVCESDGSRIPIAWIRLWFSIGTAASAAGDCSHHRRSVNIPPFMSLRQSVPMTAQEQQTPKINPLNWFDQYGDFLYAYAHARLRDGAAAEDAVQETFLSAIQHKDQYSGAGAERAWLLGILKRKIIDIVRRRMKTRAADEDNQEDITAHLFNGKGHWRRDPRFASQTPDAALQHQEFMQVLRLCLDGLPDRQAEVFVLRELEDMDTDNIRMELELSPSNVWVLLHRARMRLSNCLQSKWLT